MSERGERGRERERERERMAPAVTPLGAYPYLDWRIRTSPRENFFSSVKHNQVFKVSEVLESLIRIRERRGYRRHLPRQYWIFSHKHFVNLLLCDWKAQLVRGQQSQQGWPTLPFSHVGEDPVCENCDLRSEPSPCTPPPCSYPWAWHFDGEEENSKPDGDNDNILL